MKALNEVMEEMDSDEIFNSASDAGSCLEQSRIGYDTFNRLLKGFPREDDEPSSLSTIFCPILPKSSPSDPDAYYKRKMREPFKIMEKRSNDVREDDFWGLLWLMRSVLHLAVSDYESDELDYIGFYIVYNLVVEFTTGFSKGLPRQHYDANATYRAKINSLFDDAIQLLLFFLEDYDDQMVIKVHRRFRLLESKMKPLGFEPYSFDLVYDYVNSRLL